jgi:hypothetical protein
MAKNWTRLLKPFVDHPDCRHRPFVCDGFPDDSQVLIIGKWPATDLGPDWNWWKFWKDRTGFDYRRFTRYYEKKRGKPTDTRTVFNVIRQRGILAVETNVYQSPGSKAASNFGVLCLLIMHMPYLRAIVAFGGPAKDLLLRDLRLRFGIPAKRLIPVSHSFFVHHPDEVCRQIEKKLAGPAPDVA